jgi:mono/diheme cytochrome c family protein
VKFRLRYGRIFAASLIFDSNGDMGMIGFEKRALLWLARIAVGLCIMAIGRSAAQDASTPAPWVAPEDAKKVKNPVAATPESLAAAQQLFTDNCVLCHGEKGVGDGPGAKTIKVKPANFTDPKLQASETDGGLFWKMSNGRGPMPSWKDDLSDTERWQLVNYIRKLGKDAAKK